MCCVSFYPKSTRLKTVKDAERETGINKWQRPGESFKGRREREEKKRGDYKPHDYCNQHDYIWLDPSNKNSTNKAAHTHTPQSAVCQRQSWLFGIEFPRGHLSPPTHTQAWLRGVSLGPLLFLMGSVCVCVFDSSGIRLSVQDANRGDGEEMYDIVHSSLCSAPSDWGQKGSDLV